MELHIPRSTKGSSNDCLIAAVALVICLKAAVEFYEGFKGKGQKGCILLLFV